MYRNFGELRVSTELVEDEKPLGKDNGYQHIRDIRPGKRGYDLDGDTSRARVRASG